MGYFCSDLVFLSFALFFREEFVCVYSKVGSLGWEVDCVGSRKGYCLCGLRWCLYVVWCGHDVCVFRDQERGLVASYVAR